MPIAQYRHNYLQDYSGLCKWKPYEKNSHDVDFAEVRETRNQRERFSAWRMKKNGSSKIQVLRGRSSHSLDLLGIPVILPNLNSTQDWKSIAHSLLNRGIIIWHAKCILKKMFLFIILRPMGTKTFLDSGFHAVDAGLQVLDSSLCQWNLDSGFQSLVGFLEQWSGFQNLGFRIPQANMSRIWNTDSLTYCLDHEVPFGQDTIKGTEGASHIYTLFHR